jgi:hypothetical protein
MRHNQPNPDRNKLPETIYTKKLLRTSFSLEAHESKTKKNWPVWSVFYCKPFLRSSVRLPSISGNTCEKKNSERFQPGLSPHLKLDLE